MGGERKSVNNSSDSSGDEEEGEAELRKAINSIAATTSSYLPNIAAAGNHPQPPLPDSHKPKHYQIKLQKLLDDVLEKSLVMVKDDDDGDDIDNDNDNDIHVDSYDPLSNGSANGGFRLFRHSKPGISLHPIDEPQQPRKRPKILPGEEIDEKSKKFRQRLQFVAVDGESIMAAARNAGQKSLARLEAKEAAVKETAKREAERVAELKRVRGEKWLPCLAR